MHSGKCDIACGDQGCNSQDECNNCIQNYLLINGYCIQNPYICQECKQIIYQYDKLTQYQKGFYYEFYQQNNIDCPPNYYKCLDQQQSQDTFKNCYEWKYKVNLLDLCINSQEYAYQEKI
ncbi:hypothetical protein PPERSA_10136 [Pseudocohnilembus persalinus]|uniref:Insulin-like growth factor binding protein, N-terminal n=1 Tax=Pseudocohnilembus persalinus TaxID=266149 RepID=A0A0V0QZX7_PSEPJ|nr:hypothetical protein PPERSA_10136 [Pseudocohnilembus persalinus]|eukprot:KRX07852.1 hypothetical protein PPERSA_10136 [Pseudocohnilembus persalinus]